MEQEVESPLDALEWEEDEASAEGDSLGDASSRSRILTPNCGGSSIVMT